MTERAPRVRNVCFTVNATDGIELLLLDFDHPTWHDGTCSPSKERLFYR
nr:MAG TPA: hypothetical protein [Cressdnaviricota sp.]